MQKAICCSNTTTFSAYFCTAQNWGPNKRTQTAALLFYLGGAAVEECSSRRLKFLIPLLLQQLVLYIVAMAAVDQPQ